MQVTSYNKEPSRKTSRPPVSDRLMAKSVLDAIPLTMGFIRREIRALKESTLPLPHYRVIAYTERKKTVTNRELAEWQGVSFPAMSRMIDGLVRRGFLQRDSNEEDRRQVAVRVTARGHRAFLKVRDAIESKLMERLKGLSPEEKECLRSALNVLEGVLRDPA